MRKFLAIICAVALFMTGISEASAKNDNIKVTLNGNEIEFDVPPQIINNRTMVPLRAVFEAMGAMVIWHDYYAYWSDNHHYVGIEIHINGKRIDFHIGDSIMCVNYFEDVWLDSPPCIIDGRALVPVRAISEALGADVKWNEITKTVEIEYKEISLLPVDAQKFSVVLDNAKFSAINYFEKETLTTKEFAKEFVTYWIWNDWSRNNNLIRIPGVHSSVGDNGDEWEIVGSIDELNTQYRLLFGCELPYLTEEDIAPSAHIYNEKFVAYPFRHDGDEPPLTYNHAEKKPDGSYDLIFNYIDCDGYYYEDYDIFNISLTDNENGFIINSYRRYNNNGVQPLEY